MLRRVIRVEIHAGFPGQVSRVHFRDDVVEIVVLQVFNQFFDSFSDILYPI